MDTRAGKLGEYLEKVLEKLNNDYMTINADFLGLEINNYSLDKIPTISTIEEDIIGVRTFRDVYSFRSRKPYTSNVLINLKNIGFFEQFESVIRSNNDEGVLPDIKNIESIRCLNCGTLNKADPSGKTAEFDIEIEITYKEG